MRISLLVALGTSLVIACPAHCETLNLLNWESYVDERLLDEWTAATGVSVHQIYFDSGEARDELFSNPSNDIDIAVLAERGASLFGKRGMLEKLDESNFPPIKSYDPQWRTRCSGAAVPYLWGTLGIVYRTDKVEAPRSWNDLIRPKPALKGHIGMYDDNTDTFLPALILLGKPLGTDDGSDLKAVFDLMKEQAPSVRTYQYVMTATQSQEYGKDIFMAIGYSGDQNALNQRDSTPGRWAYVLPDEGSFSWVDCLGIRKESPRKALALDLVRFLSEPRNAARNAEFLIMPTPNAAAVPLMPAKMRDDLEIFPPADVVARTHLSPTLSERGTELRRRIIDSLVNFRDAQ